MNKKSSYSVKSVLYLICLLVLPFSAEAASFDCAKASTKVEHLICDDQELSKLDEELAQSYKAALQDHTQADTIRYQQKIWMKVRNACADMTCLRNAYSGRLTSLRVTPNLEYDEKHNAADYVSDDSAMDRNVFEHENTDEVCGLYLQNLQYFARRKLPMSCGQPIAPSLKGKLEIVEWEDLDPEKYPKLFKEMVRMLDAGSRQPIVTDKELAGRRDEVRKKEYLFRRAKITLLAHPKILDDFDSSLSQWARNYVKQYQNSTPPELRLTIVQYGADINSPDNPNKAWRCDVNQIRGGEYHIGFSYKLVTDDLHHVYGDIPLYSTGITPQHLWRVNDRLYGEGFNGGNIELTEFGGAVKEKNVDSFFFEPVCLYHYEAKSNKQEKE